MPEQPVAFAGSIPEFYERHLRFAFFEPYAEDLAARAAGAEGDHLELACGTGILTRQLLARLGPGAKLTATDVNPPMIEEARRRVPEDARLSWRAADMTALPFGDGAFDGLHCQFGVMFPADKAAVFAEARRVLRPGAAYRFNVWGPLSENPANPAVLEALAALFPDDPPRFLEAPFSFHDGDLIRKLLEGQGFSAIRAEVVLRDCRSPSAREFAVGLVNGTPIANDLAARKADLAEATDAIAAALARVGGEAPFSAPMKALVVEARA
ncbi:MAG TPA: class I SAM-dependent methyltransferase [Holophagaceae bacterium]|nr:class I SAM-dependent methyltransferase [Holophagaceae bacterium]